MTGQRPIFDVATVIANEQLSESLWWIELATPQIADRARPGQFVHISGGGQDPLLRRPYSLSRIDVREGAVAILFHVVGRGSRWLSELRPGDPVDTLGPLGSSFAPPDECRHLLLVGGGIGLGPLIAQAASEADRSCVILNGARTQAGLTPAAKLPPRAEAYYATDDGSFGAHGSVVELLPDWYQWSDAVLACGPNPMLQACASRIDALDPAPRRLRRRPVQFALEARMACGLGVCYSCVVTTSSGLKRVCTEGPVFESRELTWQWDSGI